MWRSRSYFVDVSAIDLVCVECGGLVRWRTRRAYAWFWGVSGFDWERHAGDGLALIIRFYCDTHIVSSSLRVLSKA